MQWIQNYKTKHIDVCEINKLKLKREQVIIESLIWNKRGSIEEFRNFLWNPKVLAWKFQYTRRQKFYTRVRKGREWMYINILFLWLKTRLAKSLIITTRWCQMLTTQLCQWKTLSRYLLAFFIDNFRLSDIKRTIVKYSLYPSS